MNHKRIAAALLLAALAAGPSAAGQKATDPVVLLKEKRVIDATPQGLTLVFHLILRNPAAGAIQLVRYDFRALVDDTGYLDLQVPLESPIRVGAKDEIVIALPVRLNYENLFPAVPGLQSKDLAFCYIAGGMTFADDRGKEKRVRIAFSSDFPVYRGLEFAPAPVEAKSLTIGGAEISLGFSIENPNGFSFSLERLSYSLVLAGYKALSGEVAPGTRVEAKGRKAFSFPLILDFFETGPEVYEGLSSGSVEVRVSGESEIATPWGPWKVPFDRTVKVPVKK